MKKYQKAQIIAKNLPTGSYAAGCPTGTRIQKNVVRIPMGNGWTTGPCSACEIAG